MGRLWSFHWNTSSVSNWSWQRCIMRFLSMAVFQPPRLLLGDSGGLLLSCYWQSPFHFSPSPLNKDGRGTSCWLPRILTVNARSWLPFCNPSLQSTSISSSFPVERFPELRRHERPPLLHQDKYTQTWLCWWQTCPWSCGAPGPQALRGGCWRSRQHTEFATLPDGVHFCHSLPGELLVSYLASLNFSLCVFVCARSVAQSCLTLWDPIAIPFSRGIFLTQGPNLGLLHYRQILYHLSHQGSPNLNLIFLKWGGYLPLRKANEGNTLELIRRIQHVAHSKEALLTKRRLCGCDAGSSFRPPVTLK